MGGLRWRRVRAMARKELRHILRDTRSLVMALALPGLMLLLFGWAITLDVDQIPVLVLDFDQTPASRQLVASFEGSRYFAVTGFETDYQRLESGIDSGNVLAGLVIQSGFQDQIRAGRTPAIQFILDGSDSNTASIALAYAQATVEDFGQRWAGSGGTMAPVLDVRQRFWFNPQLESKNYVVPGLVAVILMLIAALLSSLTIAREQESGTLEQLLSTPVRPAEVILGKMAAYFLLGVIDAAVAVIVGIVVFEVPFHGNVFLLAAGCALFLFGALSWGILLSSIADSQLLAYQMGMLSSFLPAFLLSGFIFAVENMPAPIQLVSYIVPARYFITILRGVFLKASGLELLALEFFLLALYGVLVFAIATRTLSRKAVA